MQKSNVIPFKVPRASAPVLTEHRWHPQLGRAPGLCLAVIAKESGRFDRHEIAKKLNLKYTTVQRSIWFLKVAGLVNDDKHGKCYVTARYVQISHEENAPVENA